MTHYPDIYAYMTKYSKANAIEGVRAVKEGSVSCVYMYSQWLKRAGTRRKGQNPLHQFPSRPVLLIVSTGRATRPCTSGAGCHFDSDNHARKERVHYVFCHQTKACAASTAPQIFVAFVNKILHEKYIYTLISIKKTYLSSDDESKWRPWHQIPAA